MKKERIVRIISRLFAFILFSMFIVFAFSLNKVNAITVGTGIYDVTKTVDNRSLGFGVTFKQDKGTTGYTNKATSEQQQVSVLNVPSEAGLMVIPFTNIQDNRWTFTTVKNSISIFEKNNPGYKVIAAINGGAFDINSTLDFNRQVTGPFAYAGNYYRTTRGSGMWSGSYGFKNDGSNSPLVSNSINGQFQRTEYLVLAIFGENGEVEKELKIEKMNEEPLDGESSVYYGLYNNLHVYQETILPSFSSATSILVKGSMVLQNSATDFYGRGLVDKIDTDTSILYDEFGIVTKNSEVKDALKQGKEVRVQYEAVGAFKDVDYVFGGGQIVLKNGEVPSNINDAASDTHPRTAIGVKADGTYVMCVIDGRQSDKGMVGVGTDRLSAVMKYYGCVNAFNLDGGGSSTVVIRDGNSFKVMNSPSDGHERSDGDCLLIAVREPQIELNVLSATDKSLSVGVNIIDDGGFNINSLEIVAGTSKALASDGVATVKGLASKTEYDLSYSIITDKGTTLPSLYKIKAHTDVTEYKIRGLEIKDAGDKYEITLDYSDRGKVTNLSSATLIVTDEDGKTKEIVLSSGMGEILKSDIGDYILYTKLVFKSDSFDGEVEKEALNMHSVTIRTILEISEEVKDLFASFMNGDE